ncbi:MAG: DinB family protein [Candidatus Sumerlaeota bacterium]
MLLDDRPLRALNTDLKAWVSIGVDEALTGLEESLQNMDDEQLASFPMPGCNNIAWITMHLLQNFDQYAVLFQRGTSAVDNAKFWVINTPPAASDTAYPGRREIFETLQPVRTAAVDAVDLATNEALLGKRHAPEEWPGNALDAYVRAIYHTQSHLRQIWALRGMMRLNCKDTMPHQLWA